MDWSQMLAGDLESSVRHARERTGSPVRTAASAALTIEELVRPYGRTTTGITFADENLRLSYDDVALRVRVAANRLRKLGVAPADTVAMTIGNDSASVISALAVWAAGAAVASIPPMRHTAPSVEQFTHVLVAMETDVLLTDENTPATLVPGARRMGKVELSAAPTDDSGRDGEASLPHIALVQFTSGSVGAPKGVAVNGLRLSGHLQAMSQFYEYDSDRDKFCSWLPLYHDMGFVGIFLAGLAGCIEMVLGSPRGFALNPANWLNTLAWQHATVTAAPNFAFRMAALVPYEQLDLSSLRLALCGAERVYPETMQDFHRATEQFGLRWEAMTPCYGSAENVVGITGSPIRRGPLLSSYGQVSVGVPLPGVRIRTAGTPLAPAPIDIAGDWLFDGYQTAAGFTPAGREWFDTGDDGFLLDDELYVMGRRAEIVSAGGRNVFAEDIEATSTQAGASLLRGCVAFRYGPNDDRFGVIVELARHARGNTEEAAALGRTIRDAVRASHGVRVSPVVVAKVGAIRRTTSGKVQRKLSRAAYESGDLQRKIIIEIN